jgi:superfamily I DNA/RNA helicase
MLFDFNSAMDSITHDCYMKKFQLSKPDLSLKYDCVMLDEAQDSNPALADVVTRQKCAKIIVGDPHQSIYSFRGAVNILEKIEAEHAMALTQSFRFPETIAVYANLILFRFKKETKRVKGLGTEEFNDDGNIAYITRTNSALFNVAVALSAKGERFRLDDGTRRYMADLEFVDSLFHGRSTWGMKSGYAKFRTFDGLMEHASIFEDFSLKGICSLVRKHAKLDDLPEIIDDVRRRHNDFSDTFLHTAHRSKGMEFDTVVLTDFVPCGNMRDPKKNKNFQEEINIVYVAVTRAKRKVKLSSDIWTLIKDDDNSSLDESRKIAV